MGGNEFGSQSSQLKEFLDRRDGKFTNLRPRQPVQELGYRVIMGVSYRIVDLDSHGQGFSMRTVPGDNGNGMFGSKVRKVI